MRDDEEEDVDLSDSRPTALPNDPDFPGHTVAGYVLDGEIGRGGMGVVYAATHPLIGKRVAIKVLSHELASDRVTLERFLLEARAVNAIGHPNIVDTFDFGILPDGRQYLVMDLLVGETLRTRLRRGPLSIGEASVIVDEIASALAAAHAKGIIHRDLKPDNVFIVVQPGRTPQIKLLDFGLVKLTATSTDGVERTRSGAIVGTPNYMSPEQARARGHLDHRTDIYALGVMTFEMIAGHLPFIRDNALDTLIAHVQEEIPTLHETVDRVPIELAQMVEAMMAKTPSDRPTLAAIRQVLKRMPHGDISMRVELKTPKPIAPQQRTVADRPRPGTPRPVLEVPADIEQASSPSIPEPAYRSSPSVVDDYHPGPDEDHTFVSVPPPPRPRTATVPPSGKRPVTPHPIRRDTPPMGTRVRRESAPLPRLERPPTQPAPAPIEEEDDLASAWLPSNTDPTAITPDSVVPPYPEMVRATSRAETTPPPTRAVTSPGEVTPSSGVPVMPPTPLPSILARATSASEHDAPTAIGGEWMRDLALEPETTASGPPPTMAEPAKPAEPAEPAAEPVRPHIPSRRTAPRVSTTNLYRPTEKVPSLANPAVDAEPPATWQTEPATLVTPPSISTLIAPPPYEPDAPASEAAARSPSENDVITSARRTSPSGAPPLASDALRDDASGIESHREQVPSRDDDLARARDNNLAPAFRDGDGDDEVEVEISHNEGGGEVASARANGGVSTGDDIEVEVSPHGAVTTGGDELAHADGLAVPASRDGDVAVAPEPATGSARADDSRPASLADDAASARSDDPAPTLPTDPAPPSPSSSTPPTPDAPTAAPERPTPAPTPGAKPLPKPISPLPPAALVKPVTVPDRIPPPRPRPKTDVPADAPTTAPPKPAPPAPPKTPLPAWALAPLPGATTDPAAPSPRFPRKSSESNPSITAASLGMRTTKPPPFASARTTGRFEVPGPPTLKNVEVPAIEPSAETIVEAKAETIVEPGISSGASGGPAGASISPGTSSGVSSSPPRRAGRKSTAPPGVDPAVDQELEDAFGQAVDQELPEDAEPAITMEIEDPRPTSEISAMQDVESLMDGIPSGLAGDTGPKPEVDDAAPSTRSPKTRSSPNLAELWSSELERATAKRAAVEARDDIHDAETVVAVTSSELAEDSELAATTITSRRATTNSRITGEPTVVEPAGAKPATEPTPALAPKPVPAPEGGRDDSDSDDDGGLLGTFGLDIHVNINLFADDLGPAPVVVAKPPPPAAAPEPIAAESSSNSKRTSKRSRALTKPPVEPAPDKSDKSEPVARRDRRDPTSARTSDTPSRRSSDKIAPIASSRSNDTVDGGRTPSARAIERAIDRQMAGLDPTTRSRTWLYVLLALALAGAGVLGYLKYG